MTIKYQNINGVILLSIAFYILFFGFDSTSNIASKGLRVNGFHNLGFYSLALLYIVFAAASLVASSVVYKLKPKLSLGIAILTYSFWIFSLFFTTIADWPIDS
jgi:hypothetical protein